MFLSFRQYWVLLLSVFLLAACVDSNNGGVTGQGSIRGLHAIPDLGAATFLIEDTSLGLISFKEVSGISSFDDLEYDFRYEILLPDDDIDNPTELIERTLKVDSEREYTFVLAGSLESPSMFLWEQFGRDWQDELDDAEDNDTEVTVMEVSFGHVTNELGEVDLYLEAPGTSPLSATPAATLGYSEFQEATELVADSYQLVITPRNEPETILFASDAFVLSAATSTLITLIDDGGFSTSPFTVRITGTSLGSELVDINATAVTSAVHAAFGTDAIDVFDGNDFSSALIPGLSFSQRTADIEVDDGELPLIVTPAGNQGVFLSQGNYNFAAGSFNRFYFLGLPGELQTIVRQYDRATLATHARVQLVQASVRFQTIDVYLVESDVDISLIDPTFSRVLYGSGFDYIIREPEDYLLVLTEPGTKNIIGGPIEIQLDASRNYSIVIVDQPDITAVDAIIYDETDG